MTAIYSEHHVARIAWSHSNPSPLTCLPLFTHPPLILAPGSRCIVRPCHGMDRNRMAGGPEKEEPRQKEQERERETREEYREHNEKPAEIEESESRRGGRKKDRERERGRKG